MAGRIKGQGSNWIAKSTRMAIYHRDGFRCSYCGVGAETGVVLTLDHVLACELGGTNAVTNLVTACLSCNSAKQDLSMRDWLAALRTSGVNADGMAKRIRRATARKLNRAEGRRLEALRVAARDAVRDAV